MTALGPLLVAVLQIGLVWFRHRFDPAEVRRRRLLEIREDVLEETMGFREALAEKDRGRIAEEFWDLFRCAQAGV